MAVLLPEVYNFFLNEALKRAGLSTTELIMKRNMPKQCVLSILINFFGKHIVYECQQWSCGVLIFRCGMNTNLCLTKTLKLLQGTDKAILVSAQQPQCIEPSPPGPSSEEDEILQLDSFCSKANDKIHKQIKAITAADAISPYDISKFDVEATISNIDPMLWRMIVYLTRTITETRKNTPPDKISFQRKLVSILLVCDVLRHQPVLLNASACALD